MRKMTKTKYALLYLTLFISLVWLATELETPLDIIPLDSIDQLDIIPLDSIDQLTIEAILQIDFNKALAREAIDSVIGQRNDNQMELSEIYARIENRVILINDTTIQRIHYTDTTIQRITYHEIIKYDTVRDTIRIIDTVIIKVTKQKRLRKKRK